MLVESRQREKPTCLFEATGELSDRHVCRGPDKRVEADSVEGWPCHGPWLLNALNAFGLGGLA
jgi:hypothetical protein